MSTSSLPAPPRSKLAPLPAKRGWWLLGLLMMTLFTFLGCRDPADKLAEHFEVMALMAEENAEECPVVGEKLDAYWGENRDAISALAEELGGSDKVQAARIGVATQRLDTVVQACRGDERVRAFALDLASVVLKATGLPEAQK